MQPEKIPPLIFLGAGNAATCFAKAFQRAGVPILQVASFHEESARKLGESVGAAWTTDPAMLDQRDAVIISCLKDSGAGELWAKLPVGKRLMLHTAGSLPMEVLKPYAERRGVLYPLQTLSKNCEADFRKIPLLVESSLPEDLVLLKKLAGSISESVYEADSARRAALHLAAVFANNFTNAMYRAAEKLAEKNHLPFELLLPIIDETARKVHHLPPLQAQTGPAVRYDQNIMAKHTAILQDMPELQEIYREISAFIHKEKA